MPAICSLPSPGYMFGRAIVCSDAATEAAKYRFTAVDRPEGYRFSRTEESWGERNGKDNSDETVGKESKGGSSTTNVHVGVNETKASGISHNEVEALTDMIDQEHKTIEEVLRIKEILENSIDQSSSALLESLRRLELMDVGMQTLLATSIGIAVSALRKHPIKEISKLARKLAWNLVRYWNCC